MSWLGWAAIALIGFNVVVFGVLFCVYLKEKRRDFGNEGKRINRKV